MSTKHTMSPGIDPGQRAARFQPRPAVPGTRLPCDQPMNLLNAANLKGLTDVYTWCDAMCDRISLQDRATDVELETHDMCLKTSEGALRLMVAYPVATPSDATLLAGLINHIYKVSAEIGAFPDYDVVSILLDKLIGSTPATCQISEELQ